MANGRVITGFSKPYVATYNNNSGAVTYTNGMALARGVNVSIEPEVSDNNIFYADNVAAETAGGIFMSGTATLQVDGLFDEAVKFIYGITQASEGGANYYEYSAADAAPFVGIGYIIRYMSAGVTSYVPMILKKCRFDVGKISAETQGENIDFQTSELTATILRDDSTAQAWRRDYTAQTSERAAEGIIKTLFGISE